MTFTLLTRSNVVWLPWLLVRIVRSCNITQECSTCKYQQTQCQEYYTPFAHTTHSATGLIDSVYIPISLCTQVNTNACASGPCFHDGTCVDGVEVDAYTCDCVTGWEGPRCENVTDNCADPSPCLGGANCLNVFGDFICQ